MESVKLAAELSRLSEKEKKQILDVIERSEQRRLENEKKMEKVKQTLKKFEESKIDIPKYLKPDSKVCVRCQTQFNLTTRSTICPACNFKVCQQCLQINGKSPSSLSSSEHPYMCKFCYAKKQFLLGSGHWIYFYKNEKKTNLHDPTSKMLSATDIVKKSLEEAEKLKPEERRDTFQPLSSIRQSLEKTKSVDFLARSISAIRTAMQSKPGPASPTTPNPPNTSANITNPLTVAMQQNPTTSLSIDVGDGKDTTDSRQQQQQAYREPLSYSTPNSNSKSQLKSESLNQIENSAENVDFSSVTSSEIDLNETRSDEYLKELHKIQNTSEEYSDAHSFNNSTSSFLKKPFASVTTSPLQVEIPNKQTLLSPVNLNNNSRSKLRVMMTEPLAKTENLLQMEMPISPKSEGKATEHEKPLERRSSIPVPINTKSKAAQGTSIVVTDVDGKRHDIGSQNTLQSTNLSDASSVSYAKIDKNHLDIKGKIVLGLNYNKKTSNLNIVVQSCEDLVVRNTKKQTSDPYVKLYLLPDKHKANKRKTSIVRSSLNPVFQETLRYTVSSDKLDISTLVASVWHHDKFGYNKFMGEVRIRTRLNDLETPNQLYKTYDLKTHYELPSEICFDLVFKPEPDKQPEHLQLHLRNAINLPDENAETIVELSLLPDDPKKVKTKAIKSSSYPEFDQSFYWPVSHSQLKDKSMQIIVYQTEESSSRKKVIGGVRLNLGTKSRPWMDSNDEEKRIWLQLIENRLTSSTLVLELRKFNLP